ncbi:MAG: ATP-dependent helicase HrpB [Myxococcaceae bacterium]|nr:ATP-dependent helicase HrpB [Myxococcaceae bacterium]
MQVSLPIDPLLPEIVAHLRQERSLVLEAPPGAGKTTRVPRALLEAGIGGDREIVVLQPRRLATRLAAARVAEELGERVGERVGYQIRFEDVSGPSTRLRFVTEGVLGRRLLVDPDLRGVGVVVLDEFHERHLAGDISLALLRRLQETRRPDLRIVAMSATLEAAPIAQYLGNCTTLRSEGRRFEVTIEHLAQPDDRHLETQVAAALKRLVASGLDGHVLVFLPGAKEIRRAREACEDFATRHGIEVHALHGDLPPAEQDRAVRPSKARKLILSTNVAETSVTIEGVAAVIDSGLARLASHSPWSGLPVLKVAKVSKASATQRAGRAGRTRAGVCLRLFTRHDFDTRPDHDVPEIRRLDLAETVLSLRASGITDLKTFPFFEPPPASSLEAAEELLRRLGAVDAHGEVTAIGRRLLRFPLHPRLSRVIVEGEGRGVAKEAALVAAMLGERDIRREARTELQRDRRGAPVAADVVAGPSDLLEMVERFQQAEAADFAPAKLNALALDAGATQAVNRVRRQLVRAVDASKPPPGTTEGFEQALGLAVLAGYPDRVARRRRPRSSELVLFGGGSATLSETSVVQDAELMVAVDAEERSNARGPGVVVRIASRIEPEWLLEIAPDELSETNTWELNPANGRVEHVRRMSYGPLVLEETRTPAAPGPETARVLAQAALAEGVERFVDQDALEATLARIELLAQHFPEAGFEPPDDGFLRRALEEMCEGARSFEELREANLLQSIEAHFTPEQARLWRTQTPDRVTLPGNRQVKVHYERGKPPWIESRLQDFFGLAQGPSVLGGRVMLVLHLLAPNQRAVQVTTDLAGFWERHYPALRKELSRRYPRHHWPENPRQAQTPAQLGRKQ